MRSHWTNPTIIRRPTISVLAAAALLVACDQPAGPSRHGGPILADAQAGTISAHGNGQAAFGLECRLVFGVCESGGQGVQFSFDFSGANIDPDVVPVTGSFSLKFRETGDVLTYTGPGTVLPAQHELAVSNATCTFTPAGGTPFSTTLCGFIAFDDANSDGVSGFFDTVTGVGEVSGPVVSGGMQID